jgi:phage/plasmid-associated DNA primase
VLDATDAYFADQDTLQQWLDECIYDAGPHAFARQSELFTSWKSWCEERNYKPGSSMALSEALIDRGHEKIREGGTGHRGFRCLAVKPR